MASASADKYSYDVSTVAMQEDSANQMYGTTGSGFRIPCVHHDQSRLYKGWIILNFIVGFLAPFVVISKWNVNFGGRCVQDFLSGLNSDRHKQFDPISVLGRLPLENAPSSTLLATSLFP